MRNIWQLKIFFIRDTNAIFYQSMDKINLYSVVPESLHYDQNVLRYCIGFLIE